MTLSINLVFNASSIVHKINFLFPKLDIAILISLWFGFLYTIVGTIHAKYLANQSEKNNLPCLGFLGNLILSFSKLLNQKAIHKPSAQHVLDDDYYKRIEAIQFTMSHDDGRKVDDIKNADVIL